MVTCIYEDTASLANSEDASIPNTREKRKATTSPGSVFEKATGSLIRRPTKARAMISTESPEALDTKEDSGSDYKKSVGRMSESEFVVTSDEDMDTSFSQRRHTRASAKSGKTMAGFGQLMAARQKKKRVGRLVESEAKEKSDQSLSFDSKEEYFDSLVAKIQKGNSDDSESGEASHKNRKKRSQDLSNLCDSDSDGPSSYCSSNQNSRNKKEHKNSTDRPAIKNLKKKKQIPVSVTKEEAEKELQYNREDWLKMEPAALGERCLAHLTELEQQRSRYSNISGRVAGRMKESRQIASEITKAMIEKLTTVGDVFSLRNENFSLKQELSEIKRREKAQNREIDNLRRLVANLEREVRSLKEDFGSFPPVKTVAKESSAYFVTVHLSRRRGSARRCQGSGEGEAQARKTTQVLWSKQQFIQFCLKLRNTDVESRDYRHRYIDVFNLSVCTKRIYKVLELGGYLQRG